MENPNTLPDQTVFWTCAEVSHDWLQHMYQYPDLYFTYNEKGRLNSFRFAKRRNEWSSGRLVAKQLLHELRKEIPVNKIEVCTEQNGVPFFSIDENRVSGSLTISHSDHRACAAVIFNNNISIGIDLEKKEDRTAEFVSEYFNPDEIEFSASRPLAQQPLWVNLIWSLKESVLKALKTGLHRSTHEINIVLNNEPALQDRDWNMARVQDLINTGGIFQAWWRNSEDFVISLVSYSPSSVDISLKQIEIPGSV